MYRIFRLLLGTSERYLNESSLQYRSTHLLGVFIKESRKIIIFFYSMYDNQSFDDNI